MPTLFDPLAWLRSKGVTASLGPDGDVRLLFESSTRPETRQRIRRVIAQYPNLLRLQLDVPAGTRSRTVQQLIAVGKVRVVEGRYVIARDGPKR